MMEQSRRGTPLKPSQNLIRDFHASMSGVFKLLFAGQNWKFKPPTPVHSIALDIRGPNESNLRNFKLEWPPIDEGVPKLERLMTQLKLLPTEMG